MFDHPFINLTSIQVAVMFTPGSCCLALHCFAKTDYQKDFLEFGFEEKSISLFFVVSKQKTKNKKNCFQLSMKKKCAQLENFDWSMDNLVSKSDIFLCLSSWHSNLPDHLTHCLDRRQPTAENNSIPPLLTHHPPILLSQVWRQSQIKECSIPPTSLSFWIDGFQAEKKISSNYCFSQRHRTWQYQPGKWAINCIMQKNLDKSSPASDENRGKKESWSEARLNNRRSQKKHLCKGEMNSKRKWERQRGRNGRVRESLFEDGYHWARWGKKQIKQREQRANERMWSGK